MTTTAKTTKSLAAIRAQAARDIRDKSALPKTYAHRMLQHLNDALASLGRDSYGPSYISELESEPAYQRIRFEQPLVVPTNSVDYSDEMNSAIDLVDRDRVDIATGNRVPLVKANVRGLDVSGTTSALIRELQVAKVQDRFISALVLTKLQQMELDRVRAIGDYAFTLLNQNPVPDVEPIRIRNAVLGDEGTAARLGRADKYRAATRFELSHLYSPTEKVDRVSSVLSAVAFMKIHEVRNGRESDKAFAQLAYERRDVVAALSSGDVDAMERRLKDAMDVNPDYFNEVALRTFPISQQERQSFEEFGGSLRKQRVDIARRRMNRRGGVTQKATEEISAAALEGNVYAVRGEPGVVHMVVSSNSRQRRVHGPMSNVKNPNPNMWFAQNFVIARDGDQVMARRTGTPAVESAAALASRVSRYVESGRWVELGKAPSEGIGDGIDDFLQPIENLLDAEGYNKWLAIEPATRTTRDPRPSMQQRLDIAFHTP